MAKIIKLDKTLTNQIAAWEVVERPISVVKELVENSIDSWAKNIKIEIKNWWIDEIIITDDWEWVDEKSLDIVLEKYTTSKIKTIQDLYNIMTFWFRWEALSSISSVSKFKIVSKTKDSNFWYFLETNWTQDKNTWKIWSENWTKIIVSELFFNTPARLNYLKKPQTEYSKIKEFIEQISLSYPEIWFEFQNDWKNVFKYKKQEELKTRIYNIYWEELSLNLLEIDYEIPWFKITGYISDPKISFSNKNKQVLFVNKRIVRSPLIFKSITDAYNRFIAPKSYPAYILNIEIDPTQIDVNVHPRKLEIRFADESKIFRWFYNAIENKLSNVSLSGSNFNTLWLEKWKEEIPKENRINDNTPNYYIWSWTKFKSYSPYKDTSINPSQTKINQAINFSKWIMSWYSKDLEDEKDSIQDNKQYDLHETPIWRIIWQIHNSYIAVQTSNGLQILDQHALAERIIYEKLVKNDKKAQTQWLLIWESIKLTSQELCILEENKDIFIEMWFDFEILSKWIVMINWIPQFIQKENISKIFTWVIEDIWEYWFNKSNTLDEVRNKIFAYTSCRSAIKFGNKLSLFEMNKLLNDAVLNYSSTCPHWRPVVYEIDLKDLKTKYDR